VKVTSATLKRIAAMPAEAMAAALLFLAEQLEADEAKRNATAARQQRYRERHLGVTITPMSHQSNGDVTPLARVEDNIINLTTNSLEDKNLSLTLSKPLRANGTNPRAMGTNPRAVAVEPDDFTAFWAIYPKRDGAMDRKSAVKAFNAALRRASLTTIIDGAEHFAQAMTARGKVGTEFIPQPRTWLNGDRWNDRYDATTAEDSKEARNRAILEKYRAPSSA
jgi:hypothetical protein